MARIKDTLVRFDDWLEHNRAWQCARRGAIQQGILALKWLKRRVKELRHCRECRLQVGPIETVCPHCGASNPARVSASAGVAAVGVTVVLFLIVAWII